jgi:hypothetical protein
MEIQRACKECDTQYTIQGMGNGEWGAGSTQKERKCKVQIVNTKGKGPANLQMLDMQRPQIVNTKAAKTAIQREWGPGSNAERNGGNKTTMGLEIQSYRSLGYHGNVIGHYMAETGKKEKKPSDRIDQSKGEKK